MAGSTSTTEDMPDMTNNQSTLNTGTLAIHESTKVSNVPSIVLNDEPRASPSGFLKRSRTRPGNTGLTVTEQEQASQAEYQEPFQHFEGIAMSIPSGEFNDPFSTTAMDFSKRGSVLWRSEKSPAMSGHGHSKSRGSVNSLLNLSPVTHMDGPSRSQPQPVTAKVMSEDGARDDALIVEGPHKQSNNNTRLSIRHVIDPLEANNTPERPVSASTAEEHKASTRLRSWYGPEDNFLEPGTSRRPSTAGLATPVSEVADVVPDLPNTHAIRNHASEDRLRESRSASALSSRSSRYETAGGIEDWTDLDSKDVDRYGFYNPRALSSKRSSVISSPVPGSPVQQNRSHPTTALSPLTATTATEGRRPLSQSSRNSFRNQSQRTSFKAGPPPSYTARTTPSNPSRLNRPFSRSSRIFDDAPAMLSPPPGLEDNNTLNNNSARTPPSPPDDRTRETRRALKWARMATSIPSPISRAGGGTDFTFNTTDPKLISRTWKGIPDCWRAAAWYSFLSTSASKSTHQPSESELETFFLTAQTLDCDDDVQIDMDVPRTVGGHVIFRQRYKGGQRFLFRVLRALSLYFPATGYVQGMAAIVSTLLNYYTEERAFVMAVRLWTLRGIRWLYSEGFGGLMGALQDLEDVWMRQGGVASGGKAGKRLMEVSEQLKALGIHASAWGPKWYLTLFNYVLPFEAQLRVWDVFILLGDADSTNSATAPVPRDLEKAPDLQQKKEHQQEQGKQQEQQSDQQQEQEKPDRKRFEKPNLDILHAVAASMLHALSDALIGADFENAMGVLTAAVPIAPGREDLLMAVARRAWVEREKRR